MAESSQGATADSEFRSGPAGWISRAVARSWVLEISVVVALAVAYNLIRAIPHGNDVAPFEHADDILALEGALFDMIEKPLNIWIDTVPVIAVAACYYYALLHYAATPIVFFMSRRRGGWQYWRGYWALIIASGTALVVYALYPLAPPRLMPGIGIVDIMREYAAYGWWGSAASAPRGSAMPPTSSPPCRRCTSAGPYGAEFRCGGSRAGSGASLLSPTRASWCWSCWLPETTTSSTSSAAVCVSFSGTESSNSSVVGSGHGMRIPPIRRCNPRSLRRPHLPASRPRRPPKQLMRLRASKQ